MTRPLHIAPQMTATLVDAASAIPFTLRLVRPGESYGRGMKLTHDGPEPLVEFYDARHAAGPDMEHAHGQFVSRYYLSTLMDDAGMHGLCLDGGVPDWSLSGPTYMLAKDILRSWT